MCDELTADIQSYLPIVAIRHKHYSWIDKLSDRTCGFVQIIGRCRNAHLPRTVILKFHAFHSYEHTTTVYEWEHPLMKTTLQK